ncbi:radical SAM family heme chaperone HemW [Parafilimonas sp.]|uniref:radical SAM family heme chaperone HemW n=1 Tax=Parafilimonas sp. TaxID=1969739 RepID=UPI0039E52CAC
MKTNIADKCFNRLRKSNLRTHTGTGIYAHKAKFLLNYFCRRQYIDPVILFKTMAGIYIHIPFCRKACCYCNFHFSVSQKLLPQMVNAIAQEMVLRTEYINEKIETVYFGGGTPSLLRAGDIALLLNKMHSLFHVDDNAEITLEANPDDMAADKLSAWKSMGINRLSIGTQSFFDEDLRWMNRAHNARQAYNSINLAVQSGFDNISTDFIYGTPGLTNEQWLQNLEMACQLHIPHLSCYALTVEPHTVLRRMIDKQKKEDVDAEKQSAQFELLMQWAAGKGYEHYEISNFAKPGFRSLHNSSYWQGKHYIGLGPSAHSFNGNTRQWNISNNALYIENLHKNIVPFEQEELTSTQQLNEYIMTALRTAKGINLFHLNRLSGEKITTDIIKEAERFIQQDLMERKENALVLTSKGKLFADGIAASLFR